MKKYLDRPTLMRDNKVTIDTILKTLRLYETRQNICGAKLIKNLKLHIFFNTFCPFLNLSHIHTILSILHLYESSTETFEDDIRDEQPFTPSIYFWLYVLIYLAAHPKPNCSILEIRKNKKNENITQQKVKENEK